MPRKRDMQTWSHVNRVANGTKWTCNYCGKSRTGSVGKVKTHLTVCDKYRPNPPNAEEDEPSYEDEIRRLAQVVEELKRDEHDIAKFIAMLTAQGKKCKPEVDDWLEELRELIQTASNLDKQTAMDTYETYDVTNMINHMKSHREIKPLLFVGSLEMHVQEILSLLADDTVFVIGILGMGGVGKTLLATLVEKVVKTRGSFKDVFWVTVSPNFSISNLQSDIAKRIGLKLDEEDEKIRAEELSLALEKKKAVIILDDVWKYIDLDKVGIHPRVNGLKVIITTRLKHLCQQMSCLPDHIITVIPLSFRKVKKM